MARAARSKPTAPFKPAPEVLERAEALLADVKAGKIKAFAVAFVTDGPQFTGSTSGVGYSDHLSAKLLSGAFEELRHEWQHVLSGRR